MWGLASTTKLPRAWTTAATNTGTCLLVSERVDSKKEMGRRAFGASATMQLHSKEMTEEMLDSLKINQERLMADIHYTAQWGKGQRWGEYVPSLHTHSLLPLPLSHMQHLQLDTKTQQLTLSQRRN